MMKAVPRMGVCMCVGWGAGYWGGGVLGGGGVWGGGGAHVSVMAEMHH